MNTRKPITTKEEFKEFTSAFQENNAMPFAYGIGLPFKDSKGNTIAHKWLTLNVNESLGTAAALMEYLEITMAIEGVVYVELKRDAVEDILELFFEPFEDDGGSHQNIKALAATTEYWEKNDFDECALIFYKDESVLLEKPITGIGDAFFRLSLISLLKYKPNTLSLKNMFDVLLNLVWTNLGPYTDEDWRDEWFDETTQVQLVDKIPLLTWGVPVPKGVRIANIHMVRLGAYLSPGTTVMHYGFVNFNAGTLGKAMVEGRISAGTVIGDGTDIGAGAGFMGTLSGGGNVRLSTGKNCLLGAQSQCGIVLGDNCVVATGTHFTQETPFIEYGVDEKGKFTERLGKKKAKEFSGISNLTFRRHAETGEMQVLNGNANTVALNEVLHAKQ